MGNKILKNKIYIKDYDKNINLKNINLKNKVYIEYYNKNVQLYIPQKILNDLSYNNFLIIDLSFIIFKYSGKIAKNYIYKFIFDFETFLYQIENLINNLIKKYLDVNFINNKLHIINYIFKKNITQYQYILQNNINEYYLNLLNNFINEIDYIIINYYFLIDKYPFIENELNNLKIIYDDFESVNNLSGKFLEDLSMSKNIIIQNNLFLNKLKNLKLIFLMLFKK